MIERYAITMSHLPSDTPLKRILLIEDDSAIADLVSLHLSESYQIDVEQDGLAGYQKALEGNWSLILLDLRLPSKEGLEICRDLRANSIETPLLMLTSRSGELDRVLGLEMGADDYLVKPFSMLELEARIKALLRRTGSQNHQAESKAQLEVADLELSQRTRECFKNKRKLDLTSKEFDLLAFFMSHPGTVFSRVQLLEEVWGYGHCGYEHTVNSHINRLRAKLEVDSSHPDLIQTVWGVGYKLNA